jgi:hypothetical protein
MKGAPRVDPYINLPVDMDPQLRQALSDILRKHAEQINRGATVDISSATAVATFTVHADLHLVDATSGSITAFLPKAADWRDRTVHIKKMSSNGEQVFCHAQPGETIDETACVAISVQFTTLQFLSDGTQWLIV